MHAHRFVNIFLMIVATMALVVAVILLRARTPETALESDSRQTQLPPALNVLLVGIDRRFSADREHCDAIHMIRVDVEGERVDIVNVPRGTRWPFEMPDDWVPEAELYALAAQRLEARKAAAPVEEDNAPLAADAAATTSDIDSIVAEAWEIEQYVANICKYKDFDTFVRAIERITGHQADYTVRVGFSQAQAVLRALDMNPVATLRFLRHRKTYPTGDVQRSYNQALFLRDLMVERADDAMRVPSVVRAGLFRWLETDMPYAVADDVLWWLSHSAIADDATRVTLHTAPAGTPIAQEIHIGDDAAARAESLWEQYRFYEPSARVADTQATVRRAVDSAIGKAYRAMVAGDVTLARQALEPLAVQPIWLQLEDAQERHTAAVAYALLDMWIALHEGPLTPRVVETAETLAALIAEEEGGASYAKRILEVTTRYRALFP